MMVPIPSSRVQQDDISDHIRSRAREVERAIFRLEREIEVLHQFRIRLVADVVTGKLDAREAAARLPERVAPDEAEDDTDLNDEAERSDEEAIV